MLHLIHSSIILPSPDFAVIKDWQEVGERTGSEREGGAERMGPLGEARSGINSFLRRIYLSHSMFLTYHPDLEFFIDGIYIIICLQKGYM